ncbi:MAG: bifunctional DNA-formamidopyrimidine glycosylase/DNA-(apurinic or apyrimidinic site) lyase [Chloroflexota bacterium]|nr:bifunctional DNA-formamidopyrimidine glycosylase/DNA-(apurinic or apyrimidinic site) lyase [Chloroflexota bacterium]
MPELPEVETYIRELEPALRGRLVTGAHVTWPRTIAAPDAVTFAQAIVGQRFVNFDRRGKYMRLGLESGDALIVHLRMTGHLRVLDQGIEPDKHTHVVLDLDDSRRLHFQDARKFGRMWLVQNSDGVLEKLGPEPLGALFTPSGLGLRLAGRKASIKALLLDQSLIAGVGNIYADEALFAASIHPARTGGSLTAIEIERLHVAIQAVLRRAIQLNGSSLGSSPIQNYLRPGGESGGFQDEHRVYQRTGEACSTCGGVIERMVLAQRSTHFCPECQK